MFNRYPANNVWLDMPGRVVKHARKAVLGISFFSYFAIKNNQYMSKNNWIQDLKWPH